MNQQDAKDYGIQQGLAAIRYCEVSDEDIQEAGCDHEDNETVCDDCLTSAAYDSEMNARQYSPFEFFAHDINETGDRAEGLWSAYDEGVGVGIKRGLEQRREQLNAD